MNVTDTFVVFPEILEYFPQWCAAADNGNMACLFIAHARRQSLQLWRRSGGVVAPAFGSVAPLL